MKLGRSVELQEICSKVRKAATAGPQRRLLGHTEEAVVSSDLVRLIMSTQVLSIITRQVGDTSSCLLDQGASSQLAPDTVKLVAW